MKKSLIFLYGLPGVGKLTVAKALSDLTGIPIYHNHLTSDLVYSVFTREEEIGSLLKQEIRNLVIDNWGKHGNTPLITTLLYKKDKNEKYFEEINSTLKKHKIAVYYFHLKCDLEELKKRIASEERKKFEKIVDWSDLEEKMSREQMTEDVPYENNYPIDTTNLSAKETAQKIYEILR